MAQVVGQHQVATFTDPQNGQSPIDATQVRTNDNALRGQYVDHDADPGIHLQSSALASRPAAGTAGRKWLTMDSGSYRLFVDDGSNWQEVTYLRTNANGTVTGNLTVTGNVVVEGDTTLGNANTDAVTVTGRVASNVEFGTDDTHDVGASGANRPRTVYAGTSVVTPTVDATNVEVTNVKANDGTASLSIADSTGVVTVAAAPVLTALTASQAVFTDASKGLVSNAITGTGDVVMSASPTLTGTVTAATLNATTLGGTLSTAAQTNITSVGTLSALTVTGDLTVDTDTLKVDAANNRVGIGTASPADNLEVVFDSNGYITATNSTDTNIGVKMSNTGRSYGIFTDGGSGASNSLRFFDFTANAERMRIDASGNVGIGATTPETLLHINKAASAGEGGFLYLDNPATSTVGNKAGIRFATNGGATFTNFGSAIEAVNTNAGDGAEALTFWTWDGSARGERARITAGGYLKASNDGTYSNATGTFHELRQSAANANIAVFQNTSATPFGPDISYTAAAPNGTGNFFLYCSDTGGQRASIRSNGGLANYQANNVDLSDARTKTDITPLDSTWNKIAALEIVSYKYNDQTHDDVNIGVIAQQVETVDPVWVDNDGFGELPKRETPEADATDAEADVTAESVTAESAPEAVTYDPPLKTVYNKDIYFAAIKALQEAMARIESLEARLDALEN